LYKAVQQALGAGVLTQVRVTAELVGGRMGSGGGKGVVIQGKALGTTSYRPEVAPCSRRACVRVFALLRVRLCQLQCVHMRVPCGEEASGHGIKQ